MPHIVLASQSPRRQELLGRMGIRDFSIVVPDVDESVDPSLSPEETVCAIARRKGEAEAKMAAAEDIVITADTMVFLGDARLGKPRDEEDALRMLKALSGAKHTVWTGVSVRCGEKEETFGVATDVYFRRCEERELRGYIATGEPMDKAGSYGVQGLACLFVERIEGDFYNVMGLPIEALGRSLTRFGVEFF
jgi:septum formation protein